jgi:ATP synthase protein I
MVGRAAIFSDPAMPDQEPTERSDDVASSYRKAAPYLDASWQLTGSVALWVVVGYFVDKWLHTTPWLLVAGAVLGMVTGFYLFFKAIAAIGKGVKP